MEEYKFTLQYDIGFQNIDELIERLGINCTDALIGCGKERTMVLVFTRESTSLDDAIASALKDIRIAMPESIMQEIII
jgi:tRNA(Leu) C34 or U34 (ribose-2'-O)-methylase TrmL